MKAILYNADNKKGGIGVNRTVKLGKVFEGATDGILVPDMFKDSGEMEVDLVLKNCPENFILNFDQVKGADSLLSGFVMIGLIVANGSLDEKNKGLVSYTLDVLKTMVHQFLILEKEHRND